MKLQKIHSYNYGNKSHYKYVITIPEELIDRLEWKAGSELEASLEKQGIKISFVAKPSPNPPKKYIEPKMTYAEFRDKIHSLLEHKDNGLTWSDIRDELGLEQVVPNNKWVRQMEDDIGLKRVRDMTGIVWRIMHV